MPIDDVPRVSLTGDELEASTEIEVQAPEPSIPPPHISVAPPAPSIAPPHISVAPPAPSIPPPSLPAVPPAPIVPVFAAPIVVGTVRTPAARPKSSPPPRPASVPPPHPGSVPPPRPGSVPPPQVAATLDDSSTEISLGDEATEVGLDADDSLESAELAAETAIAAGAAVEDQDDDVEVEDETEVEEMDAADFVEEAKPQVAPQAPPVAPPVAPPAAPPAAPAAAKPPAPPPAAAPPAPPKKSHRWFETFFNEDYLRTVRMPSARSIAAQCDFIERSLALPPGSQILDVGCGLGLHAIELSRRGYVVVGIDTSKTMLSRANDDAKDYGLETRFLLGDMREMTFDVSFDAVLCWGTSFGYFDDEVNRVVLQRMRDCLKEGGKLLLDVVNRDFVVRSQPNLVWFEGDGCVCMEETQFNAWTSTLEVSRNVMLDEGRQREAHYAVRLYTLHELSRELTDLGFRIQQVSGSTSTPGVFFGADAPRIVVSAERRPPAAKPPAPRMSIPPSA